MYAVWGQIAATVPGTQFSRPSLGSFKSARRLVSSCLSAAAFVTALCRLPTLIAATKSASLPRDSLLQVCPLRLAASELVLRKPTHAAKAAPVVCAASGLPARRFFPFHRFPPCLAATVRSAVAHGRQGARGGMSRDAAEFHMYEDLLNAIVNA